MTTTDLTNLQFDGGCTVFDFTNTISNRFSSTPRDYLKNYNDVLLWCERAELLPTKRIKFIMAYQKKKEREAESAHSKIINARQLLYKIFTSIIKSKKIEGKDVQGFNKLLAESMGKIRMDIAPSNASIHFNDDAEPLGEPLRLIMKSAFDILMQEDYKRLKECPGCGWFFLDKTKNGKRRWCDMKVCGSNDKAKKYYYRKKVQA